MYSPFMNNLRLYLSRILLVCGFSMMGISMYFSDMLWNSWAILLVGASSYMVNEWYYIDYIKNNKK